MKYILFITLILALACTPKEESANTPKTKLYNSVFGSCDDDEDRSIRTLVHFGLPSIVVSYRYYNKTGCQSGSEHDEEKYIYKISMADYMNAENGKAMNISLVNYIVTPLSYDSATDMNRFENCELSNWSDQVPKSVLGKDCFGVIVDKGATQNLTFTMDENSLHVSDRSFSNIYQKDNYELWFNEFSKNNYFVIYENFAFHMEFLTTSYKYTAYDLVNKKYFTETGSYAFGNTISFYVDTYLCNTSTSPVYKSFKLRKDSQQYVLIGADKTFEEKVFARTMHNEEQFRETYLNDTFTQGCFDTNEKSELPPII